MFKLSVLFPLMFAFLLQCMKDPQDNQNKRELDEESIDYAQRKIKRYKSWIEFTREFPKESTMVDAFFLPNEKDKIVVVFRSGLFQIFDFNNVNKSERECPPETFLYWPKINEKHPEKILQSTFYNASYLYIITTPYIVDNYTAEQKVLLKQSFYILKKSEKGWIEVKTIGLKQGIIETIDPQNGFFITHSTVGAGGFIYTLRGHEKECMQKYPKKNSMIRVCAVNQDKKQCAMVREYSKENDRNPLLTNLVIKSTHDWKKLWNKIIVDSSTHSLAFSKDGLRLACLSKKSIDQYTVAKGELIRTIPFENTCGSVHYSRGWLVALNKAKNICIYFNPDNGAYQSEAEIPQKFNTHKTIHFNDDKSMKVAVGGDKAIVYKGVPEN